MFDPVLFAALMSSTAAFTPLSLFAAGEQGAWYDPSDLTTMFQDSAGTTPVTAVEQPVGLLLDKSKGLANSAELLTNPGPFSATTGWTGSANCVLSTASSRLVATYASTDTFYQAVTVEAGKWYFAVVALKRDSGSGTAYVNFRNGTTLASGVVGDWTSTGTTSASDVRLAASYYAASSGTVYLHFPCSTTGSTVVSLSSISVKSIAGNHASQSTAASRPVLSARVNLLTQTDLLISPWAVFNTTRSTVAETPPIGGSSAAKLVVSSTASNEKVLYTSSPPTVSAASHIASVYAKAAEMSWIYLRCDNGTATGCYFNLTAGTKGTEDAGVVGTITPVGGDWYRCTATKTLTSGTGYGAVQLASGDGGRVFGGTLNEGVLLAGADLRVTNVGVGLPAYQRVAAATDYDTSGFPLYLKFDGVDDSLATGTIDPGAVDKAQVFAGVRKLSDAATAIPIELSASADANNGAFYIGAPGGAGASNYSAILRGNTTTNGYALTTYAAPSTNTLAIAFDIAGTTTATELPVANVNGTSPTKTGIGGGTNSGTGNFGSYPVYLGGRGGTSFRYNGNLYSMILRFSAANLSDAQIASTETWVNGKTKAY